ncbi:transmembrane protein 154 [Elgaria multicarinata webbii]|uniref:transmembrane protein 154 n=1 Tax=Elgaria multicarinata webbii TaxID=159646 RepID=UPI002FCD5CE8
MADGEPSGDGLLLTTDTVALGPTTTIAVWRTSDPNLQTTAILAEINGSEMGITATTEVSDADPADLHPALIYGVPAVMLLVLLILLAIFIVRRRKQKQSKPDELESENCKSPIFEEDTPSVMEIEMEELDKWMNSLKRNAECEYLPPVKEEKDCNANPSDCES